VVLDYDAPAECHSADRVLEQVSTLLRRRPATPIVAVVRIAKRRGVYELALTVDGGSRKLVSDSCDSLVQTLTIILSLAIDPRAFDAASGAAQPDAADAVPSPTHAGQPNQEVPVAPKVAESDAPRPASDASDHERPRDAGRQRTEVAQPARLAERPPLLVQDFVTAGHRQRHSEATPRPEPAQEHPAVTLHPSLLFWTEFGMLPRLARGPSVSLWVDRGRLSLVVGVEWLIPQWAPMPTSEVRRGGNLSFLGGQAAGCWQSIPNHWLGLCVGMEAGDMMGKGEGVVNGRVGHGVWLAGAALAVSRMRVLSWMSADLRLGVAFPVKRPEFGFDDYAWKFTPEPWSARVTSGFSFF
jgi:hypothetical protein